MASPAFPRPAGSGVAFVTGAAGFLGGAVAGALQDAGWRVAGFGHAPRTPEGAKSAAALDRWIEGDVERSVLAEVARDIGAPDLVFHAAGGASVGASVSDPAADRDRTLGSLQQMLGFLRAEAPRARLIYPSSAAVYGSAHAGPIPETVDAEPISPYGAHKRAAETAIADAAADFGLDAVILRFFSLYGPGLRKQLLWELAGRLAEQPAEVKLGGHGEEVRDFLFVDDAVALIALTCSGPAQPVPLVLNGGSGKAVTVRSLAGEFAGILGSPSEICFGGDVRPGDPPSLLADIGRASALGFDPGKSLAEGLRCYAAWVKSAR